MTPCGANAVFLPSIPGSCFESRPIECCCDLPAGAGSGHLREDVDRVQVCTTPMSPVRFSANLGSE
jgi:hypothetical protein